VCILLFFICILNIEDDAAGTDAINLTDAMNRVSTDAPSVIKLAALALLAVYEVVVRIVPSVGDYSVVSWFIKLLKKVSDTLNITK
jgi:hypothetical protein